MVERASFGPGHPSAPPEGPHPRTAARIDESGPTFLNEHLVRLERASGLALPWLRDLETSIRIWAGTASAVLRLSLDVSAQVLYALREPLPHTPDPYLLAAFQHPLGHIDPTRQKGMDGRWGLQVLDRARSLGAPDALLIWPDGTVAETAIASVAIERGDSLLLPPPAGRVEGLGERLLLPAWAQARQLRIVHQPFTLPETEGHPLWCVNAVRGIWRAELHLPTPPTDSHS